MARVKKSASGSSAIRGGGGPERRVLRKEALMDQLIRGRGRWRRRRRNLIIFENFQERKRILEVPRIGRRLCILHVGRGSLIGLGGVGLRALVVGIARTGSRRLRALGG